jgi:HD superfamily phosphohydrolase
LEADSCPRLACALAKERLGVYLAPMEIKDPVQGALEVTKQEIPILDSQAFQRLRSIKQLGFAEFSFPGATHNRYLHSLGVLHLSGLAFDNIFAKFKFSSSQIKSRLRQAVRLGALLHDIGHGPLSHTTEEVMPQVSSLQIKAYDQRKKGFVEKGERRATHEDYTIKFLTDSSLTPILRAQFADLDPMHIACLIDRNLQAPDDFYMDQGLNFRPILSQIVSSEMDVDRMDYLERDAYFCGTNYGKVEKDWLLGNLTYHTVGDQVFLALNRRALYTFDDFLISRHHMYLMVYFHHKSIVYEEMLFRYLTSPDCTYRLPAEIDAYTKCTDYSLYEHLSSVDNPWARRITERRAYRMLFELHSVDATPRPEQMCVALRGAGIDVISANSQARLSKYHAMSVEERSFPIFVVDQYDPRGEPVPIEQCTEIFKKYEETRRIERLYVSAEDYDHARQMIIDQKL